ncbi:HAMP domain-containing protein [Thermodesulfobacteriota bacterium]
MKIQNRLTWILFLFGVLVLSALSAIYYYNSRNTLLEAAREINLKAADQAAHYFESFLQEKAKMVSAIAIAPVIIETLLESNAAFSSLSDAERKETIAALNRTWRETGDLNNPFIKARMHNPVADYFHTQHETNPDEFGEIFLTNRYGTMLASTKKLTTLAHAHKYWWQASFYNGAGRIFFDDRGFDESVGGYVLGVVVPVKKDGRIIGIVKCNLNILGAVSQILQNMKAALAAKLKLVRSGGMIVYEEGSDPLSTRAGKALVGEMQSGGHGAYIHRDNGIKVLTSYAPVRTTGGSDKYGFGGSYESIDHIQGNIGEGWFVVLEKEVRDVLAPLFAITRWIVGIGMVFIVVMAFVARWLGRRISGPVIQVARTAERIGRGDFSARADVSSRDELGMLATSINIMVSDLQKITASRDELNRETEKRKLSLTRNEQLNLLRERLISTNPLPQKLKAITDSIVAVFNADFARIWMSQKGDRCESGCVHADVTEGPHTCKHRDRCLHLMASSGRYTHIDGKGHRRVPYGCYKIGRVAAEDEPKFITNDVQSDPRVHDREWAQELGLVSFAGYRLLSPEGFPVGVLALFSKKPVTLEDDTLLEGLANTTAQVIQTSITEARVQNQKEFLTTVIESLSHPFYIVDAHDYTVTLTNHAARYRGITEGSTCYSVTHNRTEPCNDAKHPCPLEKVKRSGKSVIVEHVHYDKDGSMNTFEVCGYPLFDERGNVVQMVEYTLEITDRKRAEAEREKLINTLQQALAKVKSLSGLLPICAACKKVRDDQGYWNKIESYIRDHSEADFTHSICPECARKLYPEIFEDE